MDQDKFQDALLKRLDVLIALSLDRPVTEKGATMASRVGRLSSYGLSPSEIASIVRKPVNYVTATLSNKNKREKGGRQDG